VGGGESSGYELVVVEGAELALGSLKRAEDGRGVILRLYEPHGARGPATLRFSLHLRGAERVDLLEEQEGTVEVRGDEILLDVRPFEVLTLRVEPE
jgi:alpha-mannosidase